MNDTEVVDAEAVDTQDNSGGDPARGSVNKAYVPMPRAVVLCFHILIKQIVTPGKLIVLGFLGWFTVFVGWAVGHYNPDSFPLDQGARMATFLGLFFFIPVVSLTFASAAFGDLQEDGSLVYLWLRPMSRFSVVMGAYLAVYAVVLSLTIIPMTTIGWLGSGFASASIHFLWMGALLAAVSVSTYVSLFLLLGLLTKRAIMWGIVYMLLWEGLATGYGSWTVTSVLSLPSYTSSFFNHLVNSRFSGFDVALSFSHSLAGSIIALLLLTAFFLMFSVVRLRHMSVA